MTITFRPKDLVIAISGNTLRVGVTYTAGPWVEGVDPSTIKIRPRRGSLFPALVKAAFTVENGSNGAEDYFEADAIRITAAHPLYAQIKAAAAA